MSDALYVIAPQNSTQAALASSSQVSVIPCVLYGLAGYNSKVSGQFIQIHDSATAPANGAVPKFNLSAPQSGNFSIDFGTHGMAFTNGIYVCNSATADTKTIGAADCQFFGRWKA